MGGTARRLLSRVGEKSCLLMVHAPQQAHCNGRCRLRVQLPRNLATVLTPSPARSVLTLAQTLPAPRVHRSSPLQTELSPLPTVWTARGGSYGYYIQIDHGGGLETLYAHCSSICVTTGQQVQAGQVIGYVGHTGRVTGNHLHLEVRIDGNRADAMQYFTL